MDLKQGIIGIVGPNGCGKSNIYDAVQWVLGEQSAKQLRGDEISDVIARGNVRRGEKQSAEAYLTFRECGDVLDTDQDQIEVGRKVESDGSGTYYLNGEEVRLKDIQDLFRDTGIGQDLYSSIGQGEVLKLIDSKPEERREIIEEAAGIASYRHRRDLTQRRLKKTRDELDQVENELQEKQGRLSQLRGQAEKAERVSELQTSLRQFKIELAKRDFEKFAESLESKRTQRETLSEKLTEAERKKKTVLEEKEDLQADRHQIKTRKRRLQTILSPYRSRRQELRENRSEYRARLQSLRDQHDREKNNRDQLRRQLESEQRSLVKNYKERYLASLRETICDRQVSVLEESRNRQKNRRSTLDERRETLRDRTLFHKTEVQDIRRQEQTLKQRRSELNASLQDLNNELRSRANEKRSLQSNYRSDFESLCQAETEIIQLSLTRKVKNREKQLLGEFRQELDNKRRTLTNKLDRIDEEVSSLRSRIKSREDVPVGVRELLEASEKGVVEGIEGMFGDMVDVPDRFETALQSVLGDHLHDLVLGSFASVPGVLEFIRQEELDSVTLRPMDLYDSSGINDRSVTDRDWVLARASDALEYPEDLSSLVHSLLGNTLIIEDDSTAFDQLKQQGLPSGRIRLVTLDGDVISARSGLRFGNGNEGSLLRRKNKISRLQEQQSSLENRLERVENDASYFQERFELCERQLEQLDGSLQGFEEERRANRESTRKLAHELNRLQQRTEELINDVTETRVESLDLGYELKANRSIGRILESLDDRKGDEIEQLKARIDELTSSIEDLRSTQRDVEQRRSVARSRIQESGSRIEEREDRINQAIESLRESEVHSEKLVSDQFEITRKETLASLKLDRIDIAVSALDDLKSSIDARQESLEEQFEGVNDKIRRHETQEEKFRGKLDKVKSELANEEARFEEHQEMIEDDLEISPPEAIRDYTDHLGDEVEVQDLDRSDLSDRLRSIKREIRDLKPVNMLAREEADELESEVEEIRSQYEDLRTSCDKLESLIDRLNERARNQFVEAFTEIQGYFEEFVAELFQGGSGSIELTDGPVLEAGVEIEIEPPGEQLRTMSALSGGEKTLGALAFLFALFERKSCPFCFLDEVDHPLDDENVNQFIQLISRYQDTTQFIIITHNKLTMQAADRLFGVTMEESGVTSVVPMELEEAESLREPQEV
ncbi:MAG: chromosome segregation protein SMC [bacterium]